MASVTLLTGGSVPKGLESPMKVRKVTRITDIVRKKNSMTDKVQKIREEVEKRLKGERFLSSDKEYNYLLSFIDSLQEEPVSEDLDAAADKYESEQQEKYKDRDNHDFNNYRDGFVDGLTFTYDAFMAGANWQKQQMMKNAILYRINDMPGQPPIVLDHYRLYEQGIRGGDKVKLIIIKED